MAAVVVGRGYGKFFDVSFLVVAQLLPKTEPSKY